MTFYRYVDTGDALATKTLKKNQKTLHVLCAILRRLGTQSTFKNTNFRSSLLLFLILYANGMLLGIFPCPITDLLSVYFLYFRYHESSHVVYVYLSHLPR